MRKAKLVAYTRADLEAELEAIGKDLADGPEGDCPFAWEIEIGTELVDPNGYLILAGGSGQAAYLDAPRGVRMYFVANTAQDEACETTREARPKCPQHRHALGLAVSDDGEEAFWRCPDNADVQCPVGRYWAWRSAFS